MIFIGTDLGKTFELVPSVPEGSDRVDVKRILPLANHGRFLLFSSDVDLLVGPFAVIFVNVNNT